MREYTFDFDAELARVRDCFYDSIKGTILDADQFREIGSWDTLIEEGTIGDESDGVTRIIYIKIECLI